MPPSPLCPNDGIPSALIRLGVPASPASERFVTWLKGKYPNWVYMKDFCEALPREWHLVEKDEFLLCYLSPERLIMETADRSNTSSLLPVGILMDGSFLVIDTDESEKMLIGCIPLDDQDEVEGNDLDVANFHAFDMSYLEWMDYILNHPSDNRFL